MSRDLSTARSERAPARQPLDVTTLPLRGVHLIEASAGTGKTFTITSLIVRLVAEAELGIEQIVAVTFTNAATAELKERVQGRLVEAATAVRRAREEPSAEPADPVLAHLLTLPEQDVVLRRLERASHDVDRAGIFTIHGFAQRMLSELAFESGVREDTELTGDDRALVYDVVTDFWSKEVASLDSSLFRALGGARFFKALARVARVAAGAHDASLVPVSAETGWQRLTEEWQRRFRQCGEAFFESADELLQQFFDYLPKLNNQRYKRANLEKTHAALRSYFGRQQPETPYPDDKRLWTQSRVRQSMKKAHQDAPLEHALLETLEEYADLTAQLEQAAQREADRLRWRLADQVTQRLDEERQRTKTQSFDGLLTDLRAALRQASTGKRLASAIRRKFPVALIDEFQDTDPVQYEIFRRVYAGAEATALYLIGDPKQSIYAFRGADVSTYLRAGRDAADSVWTLGTSYRASPRLVVAQNCLFSRPREPFDQPRIRYQRVQPRPGASDALCDSQGALLPGLRIVYTRAKRGDWLEVTAREVVRFLNQQHRLDGSPVHPGQIAVLTRTNRQAEEMQTLLIERGVPAVMHGDRSVFEAPEAMELRRVLWALAQPANRTLVRTALATRSLGLTKDEIAAFEVDVAALELWSERMRSWGLLLRNQGVARALQTLWSDVSLVQRTLAEADGERRMTNFRHLLELLHEAETRGHLGVSGLLRFLDTAISAPTGHDMAAEAMQVRLESDDEAVTLTTAHKSKGLEYDVVFLPSVGAPDLVFHEEAYRFHPSDEEQALLEVRSAATRDTDEIAQREGWQESLRLGYVALTRAKHHVVALWGEHSKRFSPLGYLLHERTCPEPGGPAALHRQLDELKHEARLLEVEGLAQQSEGAIVVEQEAEEGEQRFSPLRPEPELVSPPARSVLPESQATSSFSGMTQQRTGSTSSRAARAGRDLDEAQQAAQSDLSPAGDPCILADFPRGAKAGDAFHAVLEHMPFAEGQAPERRAVIDVELERRGFTEPQRQQFAEAMEEVLVTPLGVDGVGGHGVRGPRLLDLAPQQRRAEMEFSLPVGHQGHRLSVARLCRALGFEREELLEDGTTLQGNAPPSNESASSSEGASSQKSWLSAEYRARLARLDFAAWTGFLRGFIDLVFEHEGKLYVADYKSNHLGSSYADYSTEVLRRAMEEHHYLLQGLLYAVAVHRYAGQRYPGYDYTSHFGGIYYLFLRGMRPEKERTGDDARPISSGVFFFRPEKDLIERLSLALTPREAA